MDLCTAFAIEPHVERIHKLLELAAERNGKPRPESLPSALQRLERAGWIEAEGRQADFNLEKIYALTPAGREQLTAQQAHWTSTLARFVDEGGLDHSFRRFLDRNA
jgi:DNA-binding PadR family transcriptional regulator